jgi:hypothetical protein
LRKLIRQIAPNFFRLGLIQASSILLQFLLIPIVVQRAGFEANGKLLTALSASVLFSILINFASNQSGPLALSEKSEEGGRHSFNPLLSLYFYVRIILFFVSITAIFLFYALQKEMGLYLIGIIPLLLSEIFNPYILCLSRNQLQWLSILNVLGRFVGVSLVYFFWSHTTPAYWVNVWIGGSLTMFFILFWINELLKGQFRLQPIFKKDILGLLKQNLSLVQSNLIVHFQQAFILYLVGIVATPMVWGIYAIIDKIVWGYRTLLISFSGAVYAASINIVASGWTNWKRYKVRINQLLATFLIAGSFFQFCFATPLAALFGWPQYTNELVLSIRLASVIPVFTGLNLMNVLELLFKKKHTLIYRANLLVMGVVIILGGGLYVVNLSFTPIPSWMPVIALFTVELITLLVYEKSCRNSG